MTTAMPANPIGLRFMGVSKCLFGNKCSLWEHVALGGLISESQPEAFHGFGTAATAAAMAQPTSSNNLRRDAPLEFDHRAARCRHLAGNNHRTALGQMERRVLLAIDVPPRRAVDGKNDLVAALGRARSRADSR